MPTRSTLLWLSWVLSALVLTGPALAGPEIKLRWADSSGSGTPGSNAISVSSTSAETLTLDLIIELDETPLNSFFVSLKFDADNGNELNVLSFEELSWSNAMGTRSMAPFKAGISSTQESTSSAGGQLFNFENNTPDADVGNVSWIFGRVVFTTNPANVASDGNDLTSGRFFGGTGAASSDGLFYEDEEGELRNASEATTFGSGAVNAQ